MENMELADTKYDFQNKADLFEELRKINRHQKTDKIVAHWKMGNMINDFYKKSYGQDELGEIAEAIEIGKNAIYKATQFAKKYSPDQLNRLLKDGNFQMAWRLILTNLTFEPDQFIQFFHEAPNKTEFIQRLKRHKAQLRREEVSASDAPVVSENYYVLTNSKSLEAENSDPKSIQSVCNDLAQELQKKTAETLAVAIIPEEAETIQVETIEAEKVSPDVPPDVSESSESSRELMNDSTEIGNRNSLEQSDEKLHSLEVENRELRRELIETKTMLDDALQELEQLKNKPHSPEANIKSQKIDIPDFVYNGDDKNEVNLAAVDDIEDLNLKRFQNLPLADIGNLGSHDAISN